MKQEDTSDEKLAIVLLVACLLMPALVGCGSNTAPPPAKTVKK